MHKDASIYVAGHQGMVGAAILRQLRARGYSRILTRTHAELDLTNQSAGRRFFEEHRPELVFLAAARVGGIHANNTYPADFIYDNLMIGANVIDASWRHNTRRLLFLGSACIYPRLAQQPIAEEELLAGKLEPTNEPYAIAKITGIKLCESYNRQHATDFRSVMPTNLYGPGDNFHPSNSHVIPALLRRFHEAKESRAPSVEIWGTGRVSREFLHVDDLADACLLIMNAKKPQHDRFVTPTQSHVNIGSGIEITIANLAALIARVTGFEGDIHYDDARPEGVPRRILNTSKLAAMGWIPRTPLEEGLRSTYQWFLQHLDGIRS